MPASKTGPAAPAAWIFPHRQNWRSVTVLITATTIFLLVAYALAPSLPPRIGWENGPIENLQVALLLVGGVLALREAYRAEQPVRRCVWWIVAPFWFALALRELSWGATMMVPLSVDSVTGPVFSSSQQLLYKWAVAPVLGFLLAVMAVAAVRWRIDRLLPLLWRQGGLPWLELGLFGICMMVSAATEGHMGLHVPGLDAGASQILEEFAELVAYFFLLLGQWRMRRVLGRCAGSAQGRA
ncbi:hypothetical protein D8I35_06210 [Corticibacter populi]|uniref:Uncharacterized protein n=1 Tax=Corticibacter populi TaxID=1550736 RepID=A0A3M6R0E8_9BURK|nr:hypothetical protein [Corticibacter populi]RMX08653.1 hypothetical protein D8I35_06210 [Corticibacter populi]RZS35987.1 hypothetical protein EV687_1072 [Corticibacter populi]